MYVNTHKKFLKEDPKDTNWNASSGDWGGGERRDVRFHTGKFRSFQISCNEYTLIRQFEKKRLLSCLLLELSFQTDSG